MLWDYQTKPKIHMLYPWFIFLYSSIIQNTKTEKHKNKTHTPLVHNELSSGFIQMF